MAYQQPPWAHTGNNTYFEYREAKEARETRIHRHGDFPSRFLPKVSICRQPCQCRGAHYDRSTYLHLTTATSLCIAHRRKSSHNGQEPWLRRLVPRVQSRKFTTMRSVLLKLRTVTSEQPTALDRLRPWQSFERSRKPIKSGMQSYETEPTSALLPGHLVSLMVRNVPMSKSKLRSDRSSPSSLRRPPQAQSGTVIPGHLSLDMLTATVYTTFGKKRQTPASCSTSHSVAATFTPT